MAQIFLQPLEIFLIDGIGIKMKFLKPLKTLGGIRVSKYLQR